MKKLLESLNINNVNGSLYFLNKILKILYILLIVFIVYFSILICKEWKIYKFLITILKLLSPFFIGIIIAYLLNPLVNKLSKKMKRCFAVSIIYLIIIMILTFLWIYIYPRFKNEFNDLLKNLPDILNEINRFINNIFNNKINIDLTASVVNYVNNNVLNKVSNILDTLKNIFKTLGVIVLGLIISFYLLLDLDKFNSFLRKILNKNKYKNINKLLIEIDEKVFLYVKGTLLIALSVFIVSSISFELIHLKGSIFFGLFNAITNIIPYVGPYLGAIPIIIVGFTSSKKVGYLSLIVVLLIQIIESYVLQPLIMSKSMKLHPVTILVSLLLFGYFFGIMGMVLAMPIVSIAKTIILFLYQEKMFKSKK